jgi:O-antigen ligase
VRPPLRPAERPSVAFALLLALVAAFPWDDALGFPTRTVSVVKLLGAAVGVAYLLTVARTSRLRWPAILWPVLAFLVVMTVSLVRAGDLGDGSTQALRYVLFAGFVFLVVQIVTERHQIVLVAQVFVASAAVAGVVGTFRFFTSMTGRASGPIGEANDFAYVLATAIPLALYLVWRGGRWKPWWVAASASLIITVGATFSRGAYVGLAVALLWAALHGRTSVRAVAAVVVCLGAIVAGLLVFQRPFVEERLNAKVAVSDENWTSRQALWEGALDMAADHPVLGVGTGLYPYRAAEYVVGEPYQIERPVAHSAYLEVLAEDGVLGLLAFLTFVVWSWVLLVQAAHRASAVDDDDGEHLAAALQGCWIVATVAAAFLSVQIAPPLWLVGALAVPLLASTPVPERHAVR